MFSSSDRNSLRALKITAIGPDGSEGQCSTSSLEGRSLYRVTNHPTEDNMAIIAEQIGSACPRLPNGTSLVRIAIWRAHFDSDATSLTHRLVTQAHFPFVRRADGHAPTNR